MVSRKLVSSDCEDTAKKINNTISSVSEDSSTSDKSSSEDEPLVEPKNKNKSSAKNRSLVESKKELSSEDKLVVKPKNKKEMSFSKKLIRKDSDSEGTTKKINITVSSVSEDSSTSDKSSSDDEPLVKPKSKNKSSAKNRSLVESKKELLVKSKNKNESSEDELLVQPKSESNVTKKSVSEGSYLVKEMSNGELDSKIVVLVENIKQTIKKKTDYSKTKQTVFSRSSGSSDDDPKLKAKHKISSDDSEDKDVVDRKKSNKRKRSGSSSRGSAKKQQLNNNMSAKKKESRKLLNLKRYVGLCGVRINNYSKLFEDYKSMKSKEIKLQSMLDDMGISGRPTIEKCKKVRLKREEKKEVAELDVENIIEGGFGRRSLRSSSNRQKKAPSKKYMFGDLLDIVDSERSEEEKENLKTEEKSRKIISTDSESIDVEEKN